MENIDPYKALGVEKSATDAEIKSAYRKLARRYHPDLNSNSKTAETRFKEISQAYEILSDKQRRQEYDMCASGQGGFSQGDLSNFLGMDRHLAPVVFGEIISMRLIFLERKVLHRLRNGFPKCSELLIE